jgi:hypothetical protein
MTATTMEEWLNIFNAKENKENRNAILFLDNATFHAKITLSNVKISCFPAKCSECITAHGYECYLHIQIALQTISDAIFVFESR